MPNLIALDTNFVVGLVDEQDLWSTAALSLQTALTAKAFVPVIFDCVMAEVVSVVARRIHEKRRVANLPTLLERIRTQFPAGTLVWLYPDLPKQYDEVIALVEQTGGELNFNDALIALACRDRNIPYLASFDADFDQVDWLKRVAQSDQLP
jgi:predicted nucleic acid-binding protein